MEQSQQRSQQTHPSQIQQHQFQQQQQPFFQHQNFGNQFNNQFSYDHQGFGTTIPPLYQQASSFGTNCDQFGNPISLRGDPLTGLPPVPGAFTQATDDFEPLPNIDFNEQPTEESTVTAKQKPTKSSKKSKKRRENNENKRPSTDGGRFQHARNNVQNSHTQHRLLKQVHNNTMSPRDTATAKKAAMDAITVPEPNPKPKNSSQWSKLYGNTYKEKVYLEQQLVAVKNDCTALTTENTDLKAKLQDAIAKARAKGHVTSTIKLKLSQEVASMIRECCKERVFRKHKFIDDAAQLDKITKKIFDSLGFGKGREGKALEEYKDGWTITYRSLVNDSLNDKRNYCQSEMKKKAWNFMIKHNGMLPSDQQIFDCALRKVSFKVKLFPLQMATHH